MISYMCLLGIKRKELEVSIKGRRKSQMGMHTYLKMTRLHLSRWCSRFTNTSSDEVILFELRILATLSFLTNIELVIVNGLHLFGVYEVT